MRKEFIYAIIIGGILGLIVAFGVWRVNSALSPDKSLDSITNDQDGQNKNSVISIAEPGANAVITSSPVKLVGISKAGSSVIISGEEADYLVSPDNKGAFTVEVDLVGGVNQITAAVIDNKGNVNKESLLVIYSSEFAKITPPVNEGAKEATDSTDSVRQRVDQVVNSPTSYLGTVTDIAENTIQLKSPIGEIKQVSTQAVPTVIKDGKVVKEVKLTDVAIGDFIVAMGFRNGNHVLDARRILITTQPQAPSKEYLLGKVTKNTKGKVSFTNIKNGQETALTTATEATAYLKKDSQLSKIKFANLTENDLFVAVGKFSSEKFEAQTLFIIERP
jgi:hypothetical protein